MVKNSKVNGRPGILKNRDLRMSSLPAWISQSRRRNIITSHRKHQYCGKGYTLLISSTVHVSLSPGFAMITTPRLFIRPFLEQDCDSLIEYLSELGIYQYEPSEPISLEEARALTLERSRKMALQYGWILLNMQF